LGTLSKTLIGVIAGMLISGGAIVAAAGSDDNPPAAVTTTTTTMTTTERDDVNGHCDEAEHANDPRFIRPPAPSP
jgi:hypothetical protein